MGVGHAAVALSAARFAPRVNAGWLVFAALLADFLLGIFAVLGLEQAHVPPDFAERHYLTFTFPYSHGLVPLILETAMAAIGVALYLRLEGRKSRVGVPILMLLFTLGTWAPLFTTTPPTQAQLIPGWIALPLLLGAIAYALDRKRVAQH